MPGRPFFGKTSGFTTLQGRSTDSGCGFAQCDICRSARGLFHLHQRDPADTEVRTGRLRIVQGDREDVFAGRQDEIHQREAEDGRLGFVAEEIERLSRLVANVLTFSRRERDTLELKPTRCIPGELIQRTLESFRPALERRGIRIETELTADQPVLLDSDALCQITGNLLSNVEKYASSGHWLHLSCHFDSDRLNLEVHDHGPGIPEKARQRIFTPFERILSSTNEGSSGTGLGLSIGRDLAQRMGGTLELLPSPKGASFRLSIPAPPALTLLSPDAA